MELFYSENIKNGTCILDEEEGRHCVKVLRHQPGDIIHVIDGCGGLHKCKVLEGKKEVVCEVISSEENFGGHNYTLTMGVAPTKNNDRYEWFLEKGTEVGMDVIVPLIGEHSERRAIKPERFNKILVSAAKQSLKGAIPVLEQAQSVAKFIKGIDSVYAQGENKAPVLKLIAYCGCADKISLPMAISAYLAENANAFNNKVAKPNIAILIGPEGDFSQDEVNVALENGFIPIHLGASRLRTETAAIAAVNCLYFMLEK